MGVGRWGSGVGREGTCTPSSVPARHSTAPWPRTAHESCASMPGSHSTSMHAPSGSCAWSTSSSAPSSEAALRTSSLPPALTTASICCEVEKSNLSGRSGAPKASPGGIFMTNVGLGAQAVRVTAAEARVAARSGCGAPLVAEWGRGVGWGWRAFCGEGWQGASGPESAGAEWARGVAEAAAVGRLGPLRGPARGSGGARPLFWGHLRRRRDGLEAGARSGGGLGLIVLVLLDHPEATQVDGGQGGQLHLHDGAYARREETRGERSPPLGPAGRGGGGASGCVGAA